MLFVFQPIGFIGLGNMGGHMAHNLLKAGHPLVVYDLSPAALDRVAAQAKALGLTGQRHTRERKHNGTRETMGALRT